MTKDNEHDSPSSKSAVSEGSSPPAIRPNTRPAKIRRVHSINPLGMRVLVRITPEDNVTEGGLYLPEGAKENMAESILAEVVEVASAIDYENDEEANVSGIPLGARVLIPKKVGITVPWDDTLRIVDTKDVLAIVDQLVVT